MRGLLPQTTDLPLPLAALRHARGPLLRMLGKVYLRGAGWRFEGAFPTVPKCVIIVAPHTSNWDFSLGLAVVFGLELRASWLGKHTIFMPPFRRLLKWLGGIPVNRAASHGVVGECVRAFEASDALYLAVAPEGTRKGVSQWKTGFYFIALKAGVPIMPVAFDFGTHVVRLMPVFHPTGDMEADLAVLQACYDGSQGNRERPKV